MKVISRFDIRNPHIFGAEIKDSVFKRNEAAVFISERPSTCQLLAVNDGGNMHHRARALIVELVSLLDYLEENRYISIMNGPQVERYELFYQNSQFTQFPNPTFESSEVLSDKSFNVKYKDELNNGDSLLITEINKDGFPQHSSASIVLEDGNLMSSIGFGYNLKERLANYLNSYIYPTRQLKKLIENEFKSDDEINNEKVLRKADLQVKRGTQAVYIALFSLFITSIVGIFQLTNPWEKIVLGIMAMIVIFCCGYMLRDGESDSR